MLETLRREILLAFCKVRILHYAAEKPICCLSMLGALAEHGYHLSPGTLYPILGRMEDHGWLRSEPGEHSKARRTYRTTSEGERVLSILREHLTELHREVV